MKFQEINNDIQQNGTGKQARVKKTLFYLIRQLYKIYWTHIFANKKLQR